MQKIFFRLCVCLGILAVSSCSQVSYWNEDDLLGEEQQVAYPPLESNTMFINNPTADAMVYNKRVPDLNSLLVCRDKQCAPAELSMTKQYIFNALAQLIDNNADSTALLCEANPQAHVCVNPYLTIPAKIGVTPGYVYFDSVKLIDAGQVKGKPALNMVLGYNLSYNGQTPYVCKPDKVVLYVKDNNKIVLNGNGFGCDMTSQGVTSIRVMFDIDYIDLDYGYIGGYYSIGMSGPAFGGGSGYGLIRLQNDAHPLSPVLMAPKYDVKKAVDAPVVAPQVKEDKSVTEASAKSENENVNPNANVEVNDVKEDEVGVVTVRDDTSKKLEKAEPKANVEPLPLKEPLKDVSSVKVEVKEQIEDIRPAVDMIDDEDYGPEFEEIEIEDLDEYIK